MIRLAVRLPTHSNAPAAALPALAEAPESFSTADLTLPAAQLRRSFPGFPGAASAAVAALEAGQMLYLPAGWFHEVRRRRSLGAQRAGEERRAPASCLLYCFISI